MSKKLRDVAIAERASLLGLSPADQAALQHGLALDVADHMIENAIATYALPMGVADNFVINGREVRIPMVVEEPSVLAACGFAAKLARAGGGFRASSTEPIMIGQIQVLDVPDVAAASAKLEQASADLLDWLNTQNPSTISKHAKAIGLEIRHIPLPAAQSVIPNPHFLVVHILYYCGDAMGANLINTACEALAPKIEALSGGRVNLRILSNLNDKRMASATCDVPVSALTTPELDGLTLARRIVEASLFAEYDPYRATTHNKGVMNGIDAVVIATGNDWRAVEAAAHAYAARNGQYASMTRWRLSADNQFLRGEITLPMAVGVVGGATRVHPAAQVSLRLMEIRTARELAEIIVCVGLAQNLAAIRALAAEGIQRGHMSLHARQIAIAAGATGDAIDRIAEQLVTEKQVRLERAQTLMENLKFRI
ncbi:MAG: hydroxymethylglutaryl-CoA reductase, degradative [Anaerolineae bacterium]|nr:hydroxymethylglutaryl-CoA reductase, degradative [Anaerolineae bacterium]